MVTTVAPLMISAVHIVREYHVFYITYANTIGGMIGWTHLQSVWWTVGASIIIIIIIKKICKCISFNNETDHTVVNDQNKVEVD